MDKDIAILLTDGSLESAVLCAIARQKHDVVLADVSHPADPAAREAVARQVEYLRPRQTSSLGDALARPPADDSLRLFTWNAALAAAAPLVRQHHAVALYLPLRLGGESDGLGRASEFLQIWEELLRHGLAAGAVKVLTPLLEMEPWQVADLSHQMNAPATPAHGQEHEAAFVRAGRSRP